MANLELSGGDQQLLRDVLVGAFAEATLSQFVKAALDVDFDQIKHGDAYDDRVFNLIVRLQQDGWLREFVRKAKAAKPLNDRLRGLVERKLKHEELVAIIDQSNIEWPALIECVNGSLPPEAVGTFAALPAAADPKHAARIKAARLGDLIDDIAAAPAETEGARRYPILRFAAQVLEQTELEGIAYQLRLWIRSAARDRGVDVPGALIICFDEDHAIAAAIVTELKRKQVSVETLSWNDASAASWSMVIARAREQIGRTVLLMSATTAPKWRALAKSQTDSGSVRSAVFVVLAGLQPDAQLLPAFLSSAPVSWPALEPTPQELTLLWDRITRQSRPGRARADSPGTRYVSDVAQEVAGKFRKDEVVLLIGPAASWPPNSYEFARALLGKVSGVPFGLPADLAGTYCAIKVGDDELGDLIQRTWKDLAGPIETLANIPPAYRLIGRLTTELPRHQRPIRAITQVNRRPLIVSTNRDLMLERALLLEGVSFTRVVVVQSPVSAAGSPSVRFVVNEYKTTVQTSQLQIESWDTPIDLNAQTFAELDDAIFKCRATEVSSVDDVNKMIAGASGPPILYKCYGSYDHPDGCSIAIEHYDALNNDIVPRDIMLKVQTKPLLLLGYSCTDPEWRHLRRTLLRSLSSGLDARYIVQYPLPEGEQEVYFQIERALEDRVGKVWKKANIPNYLIADGETVLSEILSQLPNDGR